MQPHVNLGYQMGDACITFARRWFLDQDSYTRDFLTGLIMLAVESKSLENWLSQLALQLLKYV